MKITQKSAFNLSDVLGLIVIPLTKSSLKKLSEAGILKLDKAYSGLLLEGLKKADFKGEAGQQMLFRPLSRKKLPLVLFIGVEEKLSAGFACASALQKLGGQIFDTASREKILSVSLLCSSDLFSDENRYTALFDGLHRQSYRFDNYRKPEKQSFSGLKELRLHGGVNLSSKTVRESQAIAEAVSLARDLVNMPPCDCTPSFIAQKSREIAREQGLKIEIMDRRKLQKFGAGALLSVSRGSSEPPCLVKLTYRPAKRSGRVVSLVGKGVTFDSGGLSIKPAASMESMKCDMAGAAAALAATQALAVLKPDIEIRTYLPLTENVINGSATKPGDIVKAINGKTIEILNTDAEGRLILADTLCIAEREGCDLIIDLATLTGACVVALGTEIAGLFSDDQKLCDEIVRAGASSAERFWRLPLEKEYSSLIKSSVADIKNTGGRWGGAITAALFLKEFIEKTPWAHLDIAGPAFVEGDKRPGAMGFGVATLVRLLMS